MSSKGIASAQGFCASKFGYLLRASEAFSFVSTHRFIFHRQVSTCAGCGKMPESSELLMDKLNSELEVRTFALAKFSRARLCCWAKIEHLMTSSLGAAKNKNLVANSAVYPAPPKRGN